MKNDLGTIVLRDGIAVGRTDNPLAWLHQHQGQSADYALTHGCYSLLEHTEATDDVVRGWTAFLDPKGYSLTQGGLVATLIPLLARWADERASEGPDYLLAEQVAEPILSATRMLLNWTGGNLSIINAELDAALLAVADRLGVNVDNL